MQNSIGTDFKLDGIMYWKPLIVVYYKYRVFLIETREGFLILAIRNLDTSKRICTIALLNKHLYIEPDQRFRKRKKKHGCLGILVNQDSHILKQYYAHCNGPRALSRLEETKKNELLENYSRFILKDKVLLHFIEILRSAVATRVHQVVVRFRGVGLFCGVEWVGSGLRSK
jgi:hypothetical protein